MKDVALKTAGTVFLLIAVLQAVRFLMKVQVVVAGSTAIPVWASAVAAVVLLVLAAWMFKASSQD